MNEAAIEVLYIAGCDRSGSTLLDRMLGSLDGFFSSGEIHQFFARGMIGDELCGCGVPVRGCPVWGQVIGIVQERLPGATAAEAQALKQGLARLRNLPALARVVRVGSIQDRLERLAGYLGPVYRATAEVTRARVIVDSSKNPAYAHVLHAVPGISLKVLHLVRDSRGVAYSWAKTRRRPEVTSTVAYMERHGPVGSGILWNVAQIGSESLRRTGLPYLRIRYEDVVVNPREAMRDILGFVGVDPSQGDRFANGAFVPRMQHTLSGNPVRLQRGPIELRKDDAWESDMKSTNRLVVAAVTLPLLLRYGYL